MKKVIIILIAAAYIAGSCGQRSNQQVKTTDDENVCEQIIVEKNQVDLFFPLSNEFDWASIEKQNQELKAKFIQNLPNEFDFERQNIAFLTSLVMMHG